MVRREEIISTQRIIGTKLSTNYSILFQDCKLVGILVESSTEKVLYYFASEGKQPQITTEIFENALKALISTNPSAFDIFCSCFYSSKEEEEYYNIAIKVFKEHWNKLYNLVIADDVFERGHSFDNINKTYDFFEKE